MLVGCFAIGTVSFAIGTVRYREVTGAQGGLAREAMISEMTTWGCSVGLVGVDDKDLSVSVRSNLEGVVRVLAQGFPNNICAGAVEVSDTPVGRHAPVAERAIRTLKECGNTLCASLEVVGLEPAGKGVSLLLSHVAQSHNRYSVLSGSSVSSHQTALKTLAKPIPMYVWGAAVLATPPPSLGSILGARSRIREPHRAV